MVAAFLKPHVVHKECDMFLDFSNRIIWEGDLWLRFQKVVNVTRIPHKHASGDAVATRVVTCDAIQSSCSRSVSSSSNHIWKECAAPGPGYWRCGISYG